MKKSEITPNLPVADREENLYLAKTDSAAEIFGLTKISPDEIACSPVVDGVPVLRLVVLKVKDLEPAELDEEVDGYVLAKKYLA